MILLKCFASVVFPEDDAPLQVPNSSQHKLLQHNIEPTHPIPTRITLNLSPSSVVTTSDGAMVYVILVYKPRQSVGRERLTSEGLVGLS